MSKRFSSKKDEIIVLRRAIMALENKLGINDSAELARTEEKISKIKAIELYPESVKSNLAQSPLNLLFITVS